MQIVTNCDDRVSQQAFDLIAVHEESNATWDYKDLYASVRPVIDELQATIDKKKVKYAVLEGQTVMPMTVIVPEEMSGGSIMKVQTGPGSSMYVRIPDGAGPGSEFEIDTVQEQGTVPQPPPEYVEASPPAYGGPPGFGTNGSK